jgi:hypothetical protein
MRFFSRTEPKHCVRKGLLLLLFAAAFGPLLSQQSPQLVSKKITVSFLAENMLTALQKIEKAAGLEFAFNAKNIDNYTTPVVSYSDKTLQYILTDLFRNTSLTFKELNGYIIINKQVESKQLSEKKSNGTISGKIIDEETGESLSDVTIKIGNVFTISAVDGYYAVSLPAGIYEGEISSVDYGKKRITEIEVKNDQILSLNAALKRQKGQLSSVVVTASARRESINALYTQQKNNAAITDGISADIIRRTPDKNIGEVLKRVSGVAVIDNKYVVVRGLSERYNQAMLNGQVMPSTELNRKNFSFDIIPANIVENVVIYKTLTPDQSAEFGGGMVSVKTMDIPESNFLNLNAGGSVNTLTTSKNFRSLKMSGSEIWAKRANHRKLLGSFDWKNTNDVIAKYESLNKQASSFSNNWGIYESNARPSQNYAVSLGKVFNAKRENKFGLLASLNYRNTLQTQDIRMNRDGFFDGISTPDNTRYAGKRYGYTTNIAALTGVGFKNRNNSIGFQSLYLQTLDQQLVIGTGNHADPNYYMLGLYDLTTQTNLWQNQLRGEHTLGKHKWKLNWMGNYTHLDKQKPDNHNLKAELMQDSSLKSNEFNIHGVYSSGIDKGALRWWNRALEKTFNWETSLSVPFQINNIISTAKAGYAGWYKDRLFYVFNTGSLPDDLSTYPPISQAFDPATTTIFTSQFVDDFKRDATLHALYCMLDNKFGKKFRLVWGLRAEYYNLNNINAVLDSLFKEINKGRPNEQFDYTELKNRESNWNLFPSANVTFGLTPRMNLRLAYAKSIVRPDLRELSFFREYDFELGGAYTSDLVKSTIINHFDFKYEWFPGAGEIISMSLFYKDIKYPMEIYKRGDNREYYLTNNKSAKNLGLELEARKSLKFTGIPVMRNITLYGNFTVMDATVVPMKVEFNRVDPDNTLKVTPVEIPGPKEKRPQTGASNYMINAGFFYDQKPILFSLTYNYVTNRMFRAANPYPASLFERPLESLDAQLGINLFKNRGEIRFNVSNLLNSFSLVYQNNYNGLGAPEGGLRAPTKKELLYQRDSDIIDYEAKPGRTFSVSIGYRF